MYDSQIAALKALRASQRRRAYFYHCEFKSSIHEIDLNFGKVQANKTIESVLVHHRSRCSDGWYLLLTNILIQALTSVQLSREDEAGIGKEDLEVRREDQDKINSFSRLHQREMLLEEDLKSKAVPPRPRFSNLQLGNNDFVEREGRFGRAVK